MGDYRALGREAWRVEEASLVPIIAVQQAGHHTGGGVVGRHINWDPGKHARGRGGKFTGMLGKLAHHDTVDLGGGVRVTRKLGHYHVQGPGGSQRVRHPEAAAAAALKQYDTVGPGRSLKGGGIGDRVPEADVAKTEEAFTANKTHLAPLRWSVNGTHVAGVTDDNKVVVGRYGGYTGIGEQRHHIVTSTGEVVPVHRDSLHYATRVTS